MYGQFPSKDNFIAVLLETVFNPPHVQDMYMTEQKRQIKPFVLRENRSF